MRTLVVSHSPHDPLSSKARDVLRLLVGAQDVAAASFENAEKAYFQNQAELIVVLLSPYPERGLELIARLRREISAKIVVAGQAADPKLILRALQNGAEHYVNESEMGAELEAALLRFTNKHEAPAPTGRLLSVLSASGGCGASTIAVNIAASLAGDKEECVLIDLNPGRGDLAALLNVRPQYSLTDLCRNQSRLDRAMFEKIVIHHPSGIRLLSAPPSITDARSLSADGVAQALGMARRYFSQVVVDVEDCFHDEQVLTLRQSTGILLICRLNFTSLRNARRVLDYMAKLEIRRDRIRLVVNKFGQANELPVDEAEDALGEKLSLMVPYDPQTIDGANNVGIPVVTKEPSTKVAQSLVQLARFDFDKRSPAPGFLRRPILKMGLNLSAGF